MKGGGGTLFWLLDSCLSILDAAADALPWKQALRNNTNWQESCNYTGFEEPHVPRGQGHKGDAIWCYVSWCYVQDRWIINADGTATAGISDHNRKTNPNAYLGIKLDWRMRRVLTHTSKCSTCSVLIGAVQVRYYAGCRFPWWVNIWWSLMCNSCKEFMSCNS